MEGEDEEECRRGCNRWMTMQHFSSMNATGTALAHVPDQSGKFRDEVVSIHLMAPPPYSTTLIPADQLRATIFQIARERQAKERDAALNGSSQ